MTASFTFNWLFKIYSTYEKSKETVKNPYKRIDAAVSACVQH